MTEITDVKLKNGKLMQHFKSDNKHIFFNKLVAMSNWQIILLLFIVILSILMAIFQTVFITEGFNKILYEVQSLRYDIQTESGEQPFFAPSNEDS